MGSKLVFLESSDIGVAYSATAARAMGYEPVFLCRLDEYGADPRAQLVQYEHYDCDTLDVEAILARLSSVGEIAAVTTFADTRLIAAVQVARALGVAGLDPVVPTLKDKATVAALIPEYSPAWRVISETDLPLDEIEAMLRKHEPLLVKPSLGAGGAGIWYLNSLDDIHALPARIQGPGTWVVQPVVEGQLISAEGYVREGRARVLGFTNRRKIKATETAAAFPIDEMLPSELRARAVEAIAMLVNRSGFRNGYFHIEFLMGHTDCAMIDANVGRIGGGAIAEQIAVSYGLRPERVFQHVLELSLFGMEETRLYGEARKEAYAILYGLRNGGVVENVLLPPTTRCYHTQIIANGATVRPIGEDDWTWVGILSGETSDTLETIEKIRIRASGQEMMPCY